jgi:hypothetical protein
LRSRKVFLVDERTCSNRDSSSCRHQAYEGRCRSHCVNLLTGTGGASTCGGGSATAARGGRLVPHRAMAVSLFDRRGELGFVATQLLQLPLLCPPLLALGLQLPPRFLPRVHARIEDCHAARWPWTAPSPAPAEPSCPSLGHPWWCLFQTTLISSFPVVTAPPRLTCATARPLSSRAPAAAIPCAVPARPRLRTSLAVAARADDDHQQLRTAPEAAPSRGSPLSRCSRQQRQRLQLRVTSGRHAVDRAAEAVQRPAHCYGTTQPHPSAAQMGLLLPWRASALVLVY